MFKFLKLRNSITGDARRHVPFTSIIHKPLLLIFALLFSFVCVVPVKVSAVAPQIRPQFKPILDTDIVNFQESYLQLDPAAQAAASLLFGAYVTEYAGLADYGYVFDSVPTEASLKERLIFIGDQLVDTLFLPVNMADQLVLTPLINLGQGIVNKVKGVTNVDDFYDDILDASDYGLSYTPDIGYALNQFLVKSGGLYNWQFKVSDFYNFTWKYREPNSILQQEYNQYFILYTGYGSPLQFNNLNPNSMSYNSYYFSDDLVNHYIMFIDTDNHQVYMVDSSGSRFSTQDHYYILGIDYYNPAYVTHTNYTMSHNKTYSYNPSDFNNLVDLAKYVYNNINLVVQLEGSSQKQFNYSNQTVYYGTDWNNKTLLLNNSDLGFSQTDSLQLLNPISDAVFDLKALVEQIVQNQPDPNYELPLQPIVYNVTQVNGSPLTAEDLEGISFNVTPPDSGIDIPLNVFAPLFDNGKGFISYMWYMTKPLVSYTRSLLDVLTFDPIGGFNASGPGYFVLGVVGLGVIGGVIVKFLL